MPTALDLARQLSAANASIESAARIVAEAEHGAAQAARRFDEARGELDALDQRIATCQSTITELREKARAQPLGAQDAATLNLAVLDLDDLKGMRAQAAPQVDALRQASQQARTEHQRRLGNLAEVRRQIAFIGKLQAIYRAEVALVEALIEANDLAEQKPALHGVGTFGSWGATSDPLYSVYRYGQAPTRAQLTALRSLEPAAQAPRPQPVGRVTADDLARLASPAQAAVTPADAAPISQGALA